MIFELLTGIFIQTKHQEINSSLTVRPEVVIERSISSKAEAAANPVNSPTPTKTPAPSIKPTPAVKSAQTSVLTTQSVLNALNEYRAKNGAGDLQIDDKLQSYAQSRADYLKSKGKLDKHAGHTEFMKNDGFNKLGFNAIAENQSYNYTGGSTGLIEKLYGKSSGHNKNQLNPTYTHIGIGINGQYTNLVFGGRKK